ncbi:hypothetical protein [Shewanella ulleungensis]|uniref:hypothetical protein n=1 Tax=Shewanella ulleungensis TaxID=2282699 RepID=UPI003D79850D
MFIFFYVCLIVFIGLGNKAFQLYLGDYELVNFIYDLPLIIFTYFGLIAVWGSAKHKAYLSERFWRIYFCSIMLSILILPFLQDSIVSMIDNLGFLKAMLAYALMTLVMLPYYWGLYSYSFSSKPLWHKVTV